MGRDSGSGWYAFLIEKRGNLDKWWSTCGYEAETDDVGWGGGIRDEVQSSARDFAREMIDAFLDHLIVNRPEYVEYLLYEDDDDTRLRVRVWDIAVADGDRISAGWSIPDPGTRLGGRYARGLSVEGLEETSVVTLPADVVCSRLRRKLDERRDQEQVSDPPPEALLKDGWWALRAIRASRKLSRNPVIADGPGDDGQGEVEDVGGPGAHIHQPALTSPAHQLFFYPLGHGQRDYLLSSYTRL